MDFRAVTPSDAGVASIDLAANRFGGAPTEILHAVGRLTDGVFRFVGPATRALQRTGISQVVLVLEDPMHPHLAEQFMPEVEVVALPYGRNPMVRWHRWLTAFRHLSVSRSFKTVHLHGFIPSVLATRTVDENGGPRLIYSPHGSRTHHSASSMHRLASAAVRPWVRALPTNAVVSLPSEARVLSASTVDTAIHLVEAPVHDAYFAAARSIAPHPLVVGGVHDDPELSAERFAQMAVLLGNGDHHLALNWIGPATPPIRAHLEAAEISVYSDHDPVTRAAGLAAAWVFVCPNCTHGFPGHLAEAMACGLPIVAVDHPSHRDLIDDGTTGFLCRSDAEMVGRVLQLIRDETLRDRMGQAGRAHAMARFSSDQFDSTFAGNYPG